MPSEFNMTDCKHRHVLDSIKSRRDFQLDSLYASAGNRYGGALVRLILNSDEIARRAAAPWEYKSLAEYGEDQFITNSDPWWASSKERWIRDAIGEFSQRIVENLWYHEEGLLFFVKSGGAYRLAAAGDAPYDFVCRLISDDSVGDLTFDSPPSWAQELFIQRANLEAYQLVWNYDGKLSSPQHHESKRVRREAVLRETEARGGASNKPARQQATADSLAPLHQKWPWGSHSTELLELLAKAAEKWWTNFDPTDNTTAPTNEQVAEWLVGQGVGKVMAEKIATILRADGLPSGPRT